MNHFANTILKKNSHNLLFILANSKSIINKWHTIHIITKRVINNKVTNNMQLECNDTFYFIYYNLIKNNEYYSLKKNPLLNIF